MCTGFALSCSFGRSKRQTGLPSKGIHFFGRVDVRNYKWLNPTSEVSIAWNSCQQARALFGNQKRAPIIVLTGLRGLAAYIVLFGHAFDYGTRGAAHPYVVGPVYFGMALFFVLSGFVIYYNYSGIFENGVFAGGYRFFVARFARLYPLYIVMLTISLVMFPHQYFLGIHWPIGLAALTLTQSWFNLQGVSGSLFGQSWSISTEWGFYALFLPLCLAVVRIRRPAVAFIMFLVATFTVLTALFFLFRGPAVALTSSLTSGYPVSAPPWMWITYFGPLRFLEFVAGVLACRLYLSMPESAKKFIENRSTSILAACALWLCITMAFAGRASLPPPVLDLARCFAFAPAVSIAIIVLCAVQTGAGRLLSSRPAVFAGEISYSVYVWQFLVLFELSASGRIATWAAFSAWAIGLDTALSVASFWLLEKPARVLVRRTMLAAPRIFGDFIVGARATAGSVSQRK